MSFYHQEDRDPERRRKIRAREFISWEWHGKAPARVAFMDTSFQGYCSNEAVVDIAGTTPIPPLRIRTNTSCWTTAKRKRPWSYTKGSTMVDEIEPNMIEIVITNAAARRGISVFWGLHMMSLFDAAGYPRSRAYENAAQFEAFVKAATDYDPTEWRDDQAMMGIGQPFPFLIDPEHDKLAPLPEYRRAVHHAAHTTSPGMATQTSDQARH